jgi:predicted negative regulator of RcsB-dependent stress response
MSSTTTPATPGPAVPHAAEPEFDLLTWLEINRKPLLIALSALAVGAVVLMVVRHQKRDAEVGADTALLALVPPKAPGDAATPPKAEDLLKLAETHSGTRAAERARLLAAGRLYADGKPAEARAQFEQFERDYPESVFAGTAALGVATALDAENKTNEALAAYQRVIGSFSTEPVAAQARLAKARLHESAGQFPQALAIYDELGRTASGSGMTMQLAAMARAQLLQAHPELDKPAVMTNAVNVAAPAPIVLPATAK